MSLLKNIQLGLLHVAVAITFVLINGVLNRVMIADLGVLASVVAILVVLPYVFSPLQIWIGQFSDTHAVFGLRRTPYIALGILICLSGTLLTPYAAFLMVANPVLGFLLGALAFGAWGFGYNLAVVAYLALANDLSSEQQRQRTIAVMWFIMICGIIVTAIITGRALENYSQAALFSVFRSACAVAFGLAAIGLLRLEPRNKQPNQAQAETRPGSRMVVREIAANPQARRFFVYLILLLAAILGQDVLLEPYGALVFGMNQRQAIDVSTFRERRVGLTKLVALAGEA